MVSKVYKTLHELFIIKKTFILFSFDDSVIFDELFMIKNKTMLSISNAAKTNKKIKVIFQHVKKHFSERANYYLTYLNFFKSMIK